MSDEFIAGPAFAGALAALNLCPSDAGDETVRRSLLGTMAAAEQTDFAVLLSLDGTFKNGVYVEAESHLVVPNEYVAGIVRTHTHVLFGASVHPYRMRQEMIAAVRKCIDEGAVLFHWMPAIQRIDPEDERCVPFYVALSQAGIPLLCQSGGGCLSRDDSRRSVEYNDPQKMLRALDIGVKVIMSFCPSLCTEAAASCGQGHFERLLEMLRDAELRGWELYADTAAFCNRGARVFLEVMKEELLKGTIKPERLIFGSGFPLRKIDFDDAVLSPDPLKGVPPLHAHGNPLDRAFTFIEKSGFPPAIFTNAWNVLKLPEAVSV